MEHINMSQLGSLGVFIGIIIGIGVGFVSFCIIMAIGSSYSNPFAKLSYRAERLLKLTPLLIGAIAMVISIIVVGKAYGQSLSKGDYSSKKCTICDRSAEWKLYQYKTDKYYCDVHYELAVKQYKGEYLDYKQLEDNYGHDNYDAITIAEKVVKEKLKSPSSAKFSGISETHVSLTDNTWSISGWVDASNSYGAIVRSSYVVTITFSTSSHYTVDYCNVNLG